MIKDAHDKVIHKPRASALNLHAMFDGMRPVAVTPALSNEEAMDCVKFLGKCGEHMVGIVCFDGETAWERHTADDELLFVVDGAVELTCLLDGKSERMTAQTGDLIRVPAGIWHAQKTTGPVRIIFFTVAEGSERQVSKP
ncbi:MAG: cupin domain-containing protein [Pseudomonadota bacterium]